MPLNSVITVSQVSEPTISIIVGNSFFQQMETDIDEGFLNNEEFAENASYIHSNRNQTIAVKGIFDDEFTEADAGVEIEVISSQPVFITRSSYFTIEAEPDDYMIIRGRRYKVERHEPDGTGISVIFLHYKV